MERHTASRGPRPCPRVRDRWGVVDDVGGYADGMSSDTNHRRGKEIMREELATVVGPESAGEQAAQVHGEGDAEAPSTSRTPWPLILITGAVALVVGGVLFLATGKWWTLLIPILLHAVGTFVVVGTVLRLTTQVEKPSPTAVAAMEDAGIANPEKEMNDRVEEVAADDPDAPRTERIFTENRGGTESRTPSEQSDAKSVAEQQTDGTPSAKPTRPEGP
jgi:hypothetical protein